MTSRIQSLGLVFALGFACNPASSSDQPKPSPASGGSAGNATDAGSGGSIAIEPCTSEGILCEGSNAVTCSVEHERIASEDCAATGKACAAGYGCVTCVPYAAISCSDGQAVRCNAEGTGTVAFECDPVQGNSCDPDGCHGACSPSELKSGYLGCEYFPTVVANVVMSAYFDFAAVVVNTAKTTAHVVVHRGTTEVTKADVQPGAIEVLRLPWVSELKGSELGDTTVGFSVGLEQSVLAKDGAFRLRSDQPLSVVQFNALQYESETGMGNGCPDPAGVGKCLSFSNGASLLLPSHVLGDEYSVAGYHSITLGGAVHMGETAAITATRDGTILEIVPSADLVGGPSFSPLAKGATGKVELDAGDVFELTTAGKTDTETLSGTRIRSVDGKPFQVLTGVPCAQVPSDLLACDHIEDVVLPLASLGAEYVVTVPDTPSGREIGTVRIHGVYPSTKLEFFPPDTHEPTTIDAGETLELTGIESDFRVKGSVAFAVTQYMHGAGNPASPSALDAKAGDPSVAPVIPIALYRNSYRFLAPKDYDATYVNIVASPGAEIVLDGVALDPSSFVPIEGTEYSVLRRKLNKNETHELEGKQPFGAVVYGYGHYTGYMVPAGLDVRRVNPAVVR